MKERSNPIVVLTIFVVVFLFLFFSGTITSGFHFVDDHEVIRMKNDLKSSSLINVSKNWVKEDLNNNTRFRPLYYIHRVCETKLFGSDFVKWSLYNGFLCCFALALFYFGMRHLKFSFGESIALLIITFIGPQASIWWRLGPGESLGMVFLGLSFYFMAISFKKGNYQLNNLLFIFFLILSSLTKESFLIIIPAMIFFKIWYEKENKWFSIKESIFRNFLLIFPLIVLFIEIYVIRYKVGTSYAGLDSKFSDIFGNIMVTTFHFIKTYLNLLIVILLLFIIGILIKTRIIKLNFLSFAFFGLILIPNIILYSKTGLEERYLLPSSFGLGFFIVTCIRNIEDNPGWFKKLALVMVLLSFLPYGIRSLNEAVAFSRDGKETNELLSAISVNFMAGSQVMAIADPVEHYEKSVSLKTYLHYENNIDLFGFALGKEGNDVADQGYVEGWKSYFNGKQNYNMNSKPGLLIFLDKKAIDKFFKETDLDQQNYAGIDIGKSSYALLKANK